VKKKSKVKSQRSKVKSDRVSGCAAVSGALLYSDAEGAIKDAKPPAYF
jgi:hypothetical protein